jgi:hypothetical protein
MDPFHERLARIALADLESYGFCLAGGYAVHMHGLVERPSEDIDLFTSRAYVANFPQAVQVAVAAFETAGLSVSVDLATEEFARMQVSDTGMTSKVELGVDWRAHPPMRLSIGPVLHVEDAVANKMCALYSRAQARDFIDIGAVAGSARYSPQEMLALARDHDPGFDDVYFAVALRQIAHLPDAEFTVYGLSLGEIAALRSWAQRWADALNPN